MTHTGASAGEIVEGNVAEYYEAKSGKKYPRGVVSVYATGGLSSTAEDLCRFGDRLMPGGRSPLSAASLREIARPQPTPLADKLRVSQQFGRFGWDYATRIGGPLTVMLVLAKGGNTGFNSANLQILPAQRLVIALIASGRASGDKRTGPILAGLLRDRMHLAAAGGPARPAESPSIPAAFRLTRPDRGGRVIVVSCDAVLHDSLVDGNEVYASAGSYMFFAGVAGDTFRVSEIPAP